MIAYKPIVGPPLRKIHAKHKTNTGCVGVTYVRLTTRPCSFFSVALGGKRRRRFRIETLGRSEAFRLAVKCRSEHELQTAAINAEILRERTLPACSVRHPAAQPSLLASGKDAGCPTRKMRALLPAKSTHQSH